MIELRLPSSGKPGTELFSLTRGLVIIGSNGSGKSRFGSTIEQSNERTKRISAQRYLQMEDKVQPLDLESATSNLNASYKNQPPVIAQNDFQQVLTSLFAEEIRRNEQYIKTVKDKIAKELPPSVKEKLLEIWSSVFTQRPLNLENNRVTGVDGSGKNFSGVQMSDGEKVGLYLISQVLLAETNSILIIDEPELHLHKALMVRLWNKLESFRNDCVFIYITHDLDFAVNKLANKTIWIQSYEHEVWLWKEIDNMEPIPNDLYLQVLGSRKPILFVEGLKGSLDQKLYQAYYEDFTVIPREGCDKVIESVKGLRANSHLHDKQVFGLIDLDFKTSEQVTALEAKGIYVIKVNKIENVFLLPDVIQLVCDVLGKQSSYELIISKIRNNYKLQKDKIQFFATRGRIHRLLGESFGLVKSQEEVEGFKTSIASQIEAVSTEFNLPDESADIVEILKYYPHKGLINLVQSKIGFKGEGYRDTVLGFFSSKKREELISILSNYLPKIEMVKE